MSDAATPPAQKKKRNGSGKRQREHFAKMRCTDGEFARLDLAAERAGLSRASFMRLQCLESPGPRAVKRPPIERALLAQVLAQLGKCGSNLNQIARVLNSGGDPDFEYIDAAIAAFRDCCAEVSRALGKNPTGLSDFDEEQAA